MTKQIKSWKFDQISGNDSRTFAKNENYMDAINSGEIK
jgi:hypothetical protein